MLIIGMLISNWELVSIFKVLPKFYLYIFICVYLKLENYDCMIVLLLPKVGYPTIVYTIANVHAFHRMGLNNLPFPANFIYK